MRYLDLEIGSHEWLEYRKNGIGASESSIILGINPWKKLQDLYTEKVEGKKTFLNKAMKRGMDRENEALVWFEEKMNVMMMPKMVQHETYPWKYATLDGLDIEESVLLEIKWANHGVHKLAKQGKVIDYYMTQCQSQLSCTGLDSMYFLSCYEEPGCETDFVVVEVKRDEDFILKIIEKEEHFYENHLKIRVPPNKRTHISVEKHRDFDLICQQRKSAMSEIKRLQDEVDSFTDMLMSMTEKEEYASNLFKWTKIKMKGHVQYDSIPELSGVDLEAYRKGFKEVWRMTEIKNPDETHKASSG